MKILFLSNGTMPDYQCDSLYDGLVSLEGQENIIDHQPLWYMRKSNFGEGKLDLASIYGRGYTLYGRLPDAEVDRTDIVEKIKKHYFSLIVYASIQRNQAYFGGVTSIYKPSEIVFVDGEDHPGALVIQDKGLYLKRELCGDFVGMYPISFGIPKEKVLPEMPKKTIFMAPYDPLVNREYAYNTEESYYQQYADSYFGPTMKKSGWACLRHFEQLGNWCIPYFRCIDQCPPMVMQDLPKRELDLCRRLIEYGPAGCETAMDLWPRIIEPIMKITREKLTTEAVARGVLDLVLANK